LFYLTGSGFWWRNTSRHKKSNVWSTTKNDGKTNERRTSMSYSCMRTQDGRCCDVKPVK